MSYKNIRIFDYPRFAEPLRDELRDNAERVATENGLDIEFIRKKENAACPHGVWIDLPRYPDLLKEIERIAENEERTVEAQIRWWLRRNFHTLRKGDAA